ncbi:formin-like protein 2 [Eutrema salsugineum]|uniref:formin-like protein 2 n=1 Tax=Eutrema salsugineum TaxID=72664 RepID=UPI000CED1068|nr:formin-like protein 2 [Eutrema salsugineum]
MTRRRTHYINFMADGHSHFRTSASGNIEIPSSSGASQVPNTAAEQSPPPPPPPPPPPAPEPRPPQPYAQFTIEDLLALPGWGALRRLVPGKAEPGSYWFDLDNCVGRSVSDTIKSHFVEPHYNWSRVSQETFDTWYKCFAQRWNWDIGINETVREAFRLKAQKRLVNTVSDWKRKWETDGDDAKPSPMSTSCWNGLKAYWMNPHAQDVAGKCSAVRNRVGPDGQKLVTPHTSGQISFAGRRLMMRIAERETQATPNGTIQVPLTVLEQDQIFEEV